jgi:hypothetical protein
MNANKMLLSLFSVALLSACASQGATVTYEGTTLRKGAVNEGEKDAVSNLYLSGVEQEEEAENGDSAIVSSPQSEVASSVASKTATPLNYKAEYHFSLDVKHANQGFSFEREDKADGVLIALVDEAGCRARLTRSHSGSATMPFGSWKDSESTVITYQNGYAYLANAVTNNHFVNNGKFAYAIPAYQDIYEVLSDYDYRLSSDLKFEAEESANKTQTNALIDDHEVTIEDIQGQNVTLQFVYSAKGTYTLTFDTETGRLVSYDLELDAAYEAKEKSADQTFQSGSVEVHVSAAFTYGGQTLEPLSAEEIAQYALTPAK